MWYIDVTLSSNAAFHAAGSTSSTVPLGTEPAQLNSTSTRPAVFANAAIAAGSRTSSTWPSQPASVAKAFPSMSAANTRAPARAKASALARPMPEPAAVTIAVFPESRSDSISPARYFCIDELTLCRRQRREQLVARGSPVVI